MLLLKRFESLHPFTREEAWKIFRLAAYAEAVGWTILITGVSINHYHLPGQSISIPIAGQIHGMLFLAYFTATFFTYPSLEWKRLKTLFAFLAGVLPYGTLIFEFSVARSELKNRTLNKKVALIIRAEDKLLMAQPSKGIKWQLPTINLREKESELQAAIRLIRTCFGIKSDLKKLNTNKGTNISYFTVNNPSDFFALNLHEAAERSPYIDEFAIFDSNSVDNDILPD